MKRFRNARWAAVLLATGCSADVTAPPQREDLEYAVLFTGSADGGGMRLFTAGLGDAPAVSVAGGIDGNFPASSRDGRIVVFNQGGESGDPRIMILRPGLRTPVEVTGTTGLSGLQPALNASGTRIAFSSPHDDSYGDIYVADLAGVAVTNLERITNTPGPDLNAKWSPDGERIAFTSYRAGYPSIWVMRADGSEPRQVTYGGEEFSDYSPSWSADGSVLAFQRIGIDASRIGLVSIEGGEPSFFELSGRSYTPSWSPDGAYIAISSNADDITILSPTGALVRRIERTGIDRSPSWVPRDSPWVQSAE